MKSIEERKYRDWSSLPSDIIHSITKLVPISEQIRCQLVCKAWHSAIMPLQLPLHWFVIPHVDDEICFTFASVSTDDTFEHALLPNNIGSAGKKVVGSQHGYIVVFDKFLNVHFQNPFSGVHYNLPPLTTLPGIKPIQKTNPDGSIYHWGFEYLPTPWHSNFAYGYSWSLCSLNRVSIKKIVFSSLNPESNDFVALATYKSNRTNNIIYTRAGDDGWRHFEIEHLPEGFELHDDIIFCGGKFYSLTRRFQVFSYDFSTSTPRVTLIAAGQVPHNFRGGANKHLAFSKDGDLLMVLRDGIYTKVDNYIGILRFITKTCHIIRLKKTNPYLDTVDDLEDCSLLLGVNNAMTVSIVDGPGIRSNCIYFTDAEITSCINGEGTRWYEPVRDAGIFDMKTKKFEPFYSSEFYLHKRRPLWLHIRLPSPT